MVGPRKPGFSQFGGLTGDLESGSRKRQGFAEARKTAQGRGKTRRKDTMRVVVACGFVAFVATWAYLLVMFVFGSTSETLTEQKLDHVDARGAEAKVAVAVGLTGWKLMEALFRIGEKNPADLARLLEEEDPLKVNTVTSPNAFECPAGEEQFSEPDVRDHAAEERFKEGQGFVYYQHLRKAGGTGFCEMASRNMKHSEVPMYHCMPDDRGAMATPPWSDSQHLLKQMDANGYRITANEWDAFPASHLELTGAVFGTTFRHPVDRWYSQYRFEHVEHRDGTKPGAIPLPFDRWYQQMKPYTMGDNYYVKTFCGQSNPSDKMLLKDTNKQGKPKHVADLSWSYHKFNNWGSKVSLGNFRAAVENLRKFNLILILEFVEDEMWALEESLGWRHARKQVLPHERQAVRQDKKSISAREALDSSVWTSTIESNVFDLLLFHWAKRMYLERSACRKNVANNAGMAIAGLPPKTDINQ